MNKVKQLAKQKYLEFSAYDGSQHIASEHAIYRVLENIKNNKCKDILEIGLGIGTMYSAAYNLYPSINYFGTENNEFCLNSLRYNLSSSYEKLNLLSNITEVENEKFDLIIIDGTDNSIEQLPVLTKKNSVLIIEGDRKQQELKIKNIFPSSKYVHIISLQKNDINGVFDKNSYQGGVKVFFINPTLNQYSYYIKHKWLTFIKYKIRKVKK